MQRHHAYSDEYHAESNLVGLGHSAESGSDLGHISLWISLQSDMIEMMDKHLDVAEWVMSTSHCSVSDHLSTMLHYLLSTPALLWLRDEYHPHLAECLMDGRIQARVRMASFPLAPARRLCTALPINQCALTRPVRGLVQAQQYQSLTARVTAVEPPVAFLIPALPPTPYHNVLQHPNAHQCTDKPSAISATTAPALLACLPSAPRSRLNPEQSRHDSSALTSPSPPSQSSSRVGGRFSLASRYQIVTVVPCSLQESSGYTHDLHRSYRRVCLLLRDDLVDSPLLRPGDDIIVTGVASPLPLSLPKVSAGVQQPHWRQPGRQQQRHMSVEGMMPAPASTADPATNNIPSSSLSSALPASSLSAHLSLPFRREDPAIGCMWMEVNAIRRTCHEVLVDSFASASAPTIPNDPDHSPGSSTSTAPTNALTTPVPQSAAVSDALRRLPARLAKEVARLVPPLEAFIPPPSAHYRGCHAEVWQHTLDIVHTLGASYVPPHEYVKLRLLLLLVLVSAQGSFIVEQTRAVLKEILSEEDGDLSQAAGVEELYNPQISTLSLCVLNVEDDELRNRIVRGAAALHPRAVCISSHRLLTDASSAATTIACSDGLFLYSPSRALTAAQDGPALACFGVSAEAQMMSLTSSTATATSSSSFLSPASGSTSMLRGGRLRTGSGVSNHSSRARGQGEEHGIAQGRSSHVAEDIQTVAPVEERLPPSQATIALFPATRVSPLRNSGQLAPGERVVLGLFDVIATLHDSWDPRMDARVTRGVLEGTNTRREDGNNDALDSLSQTSSSSTAVALALEAQLLDRLRSARLMSVTVGPEAQLLLRRYYVACRCVSPEAMGPRDLVRLVKLTINHARLHLRSTGLVADVVVAIMLAEETQAARASPVLCGAPMASAAGGRAGADSRAGWKSKEYMGLADEDIGAQNGQSPLLRFKCLNDDVFNIDALFAHCETSANGQTGGVATNIATTRFKMFYQSLLEFIEDAELHRQQSRRGQSVFRWAS